MSTYNTDHTVNTNEYGVLDSDNVNNTLPMLANYYHSVGLYTFSSADSSEISGSSNSESDEGEGESDELSHYSDVSGNSLPSESATPETPSIDVS